MSLFTIISAMVGSSTSSPTPPPSDYFDPVSGTINFTDSHFMYSANGFTKTGYTGRSPGGYVEFRTSETDFSVKVGGGWSGHGAQSQVYLWVDGVYNQTLTLTADNTTQTIAITSLAAGEKIVRLINGYAANPDAASNVNLPDATVSVQGVVTTGNIEIKKPVVPTKKILLVGMSITTGATCDRPTDTSWPMQLRNNDDFPIQLDSYGGRTLSNAVLNFGSTEASAMVAYHRAQLTGITTKEVWMDLVTNDFFFNISKATWKTRVALYADTLHTADPSITLIWLRPTDRLSYDTANSGGATLGDLADGIDEVAATRSSWFKVMGNKTDLTLANTSDGLHPNQTGHNELYTARKSEYLAL